MPSLRQAAQRVRSAGAQLRTRLSTAVEGKGEAIKWYFATDESGSSGESGLHARLAVLSALQNTRLKPHLITTGFRNAFTAWMEAHGVRIIEGKQPLAATIGEMADAGRYSRSYAGHWLRCEIPLIENEDEFVLYTDCDVVFLRGIRMRTIRPPLLACAPEFKMEGADYFNSGVMWMNVAGLRDASPTFLAFARDEIRKLDGEVYHDQFAYNAFFRDRWTSLDPKFNWKPYWNDIDRASILHFHGAKLMAIRMLFERDLPFQELFWSQIGSLVASFPEGYTRSIEAVLRATSEADLPERTWISDVLRSLKTSRVPIPPEAVSLDFMATKLT